MGQPAATQVSSIPACLPEQLLLARLNSPDGSLNGVTAGHLSVVSGNCARDNIARTAST
jgi:hypothetical protein